MEWMFTWFDYVTIGILLFSIVISFYRGFVREAMSILTWVIGIVLAVKFSPVLSTYVPWVTSPPLQYVIAFVAIFLLVFIVGIFFAKLVKNLSYSVGFGVIDHVLGFAFGLFRGGVIVVLLIMLIGTTPYSKGRWFQQCMTVRYSKNIVLWAETFLPKGVENLHQWLSEKADPANAHQIIQKAHYVISRAHKDVLKTGV